MEPTIAPGLDGCIGTILSHAPERVLSFSGVEKALQLLQDVINTLLELCGTGTR